MKILKIIGISTVLMAVIALGAYVIWYWDYNCCRYGEGCERFNMGNQYCDNLRAFKN